MQYAGSALNIAWLAVCLGAFAGFLISAGRQDWPGRRMLTSRALALGLALISLFPCVSATDDAVRLIQLNSQFSGEEPDRLSRPAPPSNPEPLATLVGLLEALESAQVSGVVVLNVALGLFALALALDSVSSDRFLPACPGRAPPCCSFVSV